VYHHPGLSRLRECFQSSSGKPSPPNDSAPRDRPQHRRLARSVHSGEYVGTAMRLALPSENRYPAFQTARCSRQLVASAAWFQSTASHPAPRLALPVPSHRYNMPVQPGTAFISLSSPASSSSTGTCAPSPTGPSFHRRGGQSRFLRPLRPLLHRPDPRLRHHRLPPRTRLMGSACPVPAPHPGGHQHPGQPDSARRLAPHGLVPQPRLGPAHRASDWDWSSRWASPFTLPGPHLHQSTSTAAMPRELAA